MDESPSEIGARSEREVAYALEHAGWSVYRPAFAAHARVDLIALRGAEVQRIQVKTARGSDSVIEFRPCSHTGGLPRGYEGEVDAFGVYSPDLDRVYLVPIELASTRTCLLRLSPPANNQQQGIRWAADYEVRRRC